MGAARLCKEVWAFHPTRLLCTELEESQSKMSFKETHIVQHHPAETGGMNECCSLGRANPTRTTLATAATSLLQHGASMRRAAVPKPASQQSFCFKTRLLRTKGGGRASVRGCGHQAGDTSKPVSTNMRISNLLLLKTKAGILTQSQAWKEK